MHLPGHSKICDFVDVVLTDEDVSGREVSVDAAPHREELHTLGHLKCQRKIIKLGKVKRIFIIQFLVGAVLTVFYSIR